MRQRLIQILLQALKHHCLKVLSEELPQVTRRLVAAAQPRPMKHVRILTLSDDLPQVALALAETQAFHPDQRPPETQSLTAYHAQDFRELYRLARARLDKIRRLIPFDPPATLEPLHVVEQPELKGLNDWLGQLWERVSAYEEEYRRLDEEERLIREHLAALDNFAQLNIPLGLLRAKRRFLNVHLGLLPRENLRQLTGAVSLAGHLLHVYRRGGEHLHVVILGPADPQDPSRLEGVLSAAGFQPLPIPPDLDRTPAELEGEFKRRLEALAQERALLNQRLKEWADLQRDRLTEAERLLTLAEPIVSLEPTIHSRGHLSYLAGWVPAAAVEDFQKRLKEILGHTYDLHIRDPRPDERPLVPTLPVQERLLLPFATLVRQYGIPAYGELDPTPFFAASFLLMFGTMFGDLGQGAVIAGVACALRERFKRLWTLGLLAGVSSMLFGLLYGSLFGYEGLLPALWMSPLEDPLLMLGLALGWGIFFIVVACLFAIYNRWALGQWREALLGHHGVVNLVLYLALIAGGLRLALGGEFGLVPALLTVLSLGLLGGYAWYHQQGIAPGERLLVAAMETLEILISYVSNTLSFLRVAAFSLNHVALSIGIFTLAEMMDTWGSVLTIVLGNLFVLVMEGGIVTIQVMRLEYYEGFSRYFAGTGLIFRPIRLRAEAS